MVPQNAGRREQSGKDWSDHYAEGLAIAVRLEHETDASTFEQLRRIAGYFAVPEDEERLITTWWKALGPYVLGYRPAALTATTCSAQSARWGQIIALIMCSTVLL